MVYVFKIVHDNLYKIGKSTYPNNRFKEVNSSCPYEMIILNTYKVNYPNIVEKRLQDHFKEHNIKAEWFRLTDEQVSNIPKHIKEFDYHRGQYE